MVFRPYRELAFDITILVSFHDNVGKSGNKICLLMFHIPFMCILNTLSNKTYL